MSTGYRLFGGPDCTDNLFLKARVFLPGVGCDIDAGLWMAFCLSLIADEAGCSRRGDVAARLDGDPDRKR
ncbi:hypothetical protein AAFX91_31250 [Bradyrhizobium sp. 31Argb]|uniref:hypothetical protein n=1 Tax=Bradyrhizobium sp. 31Argb TaxID=3141247 RepID=UPI00374A5667